MEDRTQSALRALGQRISRLEDGTEVAVQDAGIIARLDRIQDDVTEVKQGLKDLNGAVRLNREDIVILKATSLRWDVVKMSAIITGVAVVVGVLLKVAGLL